MERCLRVIGIEGQVLILTFWLFWCGRRQQQFRFLVLTGVTFGLSLNTYLLARLIRPIIVDFILFELDMAAIEKNLTISDQLFLVKRSLIAPGVCPVVFTPLRENVCQLK